MTNKEFIDAMIDLVHDYEKSQNRCELCGAAPMQANCNNANCDTKVFNDFIGMNPEDELNKLTIRRK